MKTIKNRVKELRASIFALILLAGCEDKSVNPPIDESTDGLKAPSNLTAEFRADPGGGDYGQDGAGYLTLRWYDNSDHEWGVVVEESIGTNENFEVPEWGCLWGEGQEFTGLWSSYHFKPEKSYYYRIRAFIGNKDEREFSDYSNEASVYVE